MEILEENVSKQELKDFLYNGMQINDSSLYESVCKSQANIFQFTGATSRPFVVKAQPKKFDDLISLNAISRPGSSFCFPDFIANGDTKSKYPPIIAEELKDSHGCILFQEQIMRLVEKLSNKKIKGNDARKLLKVLGKGNKGQTPENMAKWDSFIKTIKDESKNIISDKDIEEFASDLLKLSQYSFNKSHAGAYAYVSLETLYMTVYFRQYYWAASLSYAYDNDRLKQTLFEARQEGFEIIPPDVNVSKENFTPKDNKIYFGLSEIKGVGDEPAKLIIKNRPYRNIKDVVNKNFRNKCVNKRVISSLAGAGCFDSLCNYNRNKAFNIVEEFYNDKKSNKSPEMNALIFTQLNNTHSKDRETTVEENINYEIEYLGNNYFQSVWDLKDKEVKELIEDGKCVANFEDVKQSLNSREYVPVYVQEIQLHTQHNGKEMAFVTVIDILENQVRLPIFGNYWPHFKSTLSKNNFYLFSICYDVNNDNVIFGSKNFIKSVDTIKKFVKEF